MPANPEEVRFFLDGREDLTERVRATGASTTEVMAAVGLCEAESGIAARLPTGRLRTVCTVLADARDDDAIELSVDDVEWLP